MKLSLTRVPVTSALRLRNEIRWTSSDYCMLSARIEPHSCTASDKSTSATFAGLYTPFYRLKFNQSSWRLSISIALYFYECFQQWRKSMPNSIRPRWFWRLFCVYSCKANRVRCFEMNQWMQRTFSALFDPLRFLLYSLLLFYHWIWLILAVGVDWSDSWQQSGNWSSLLSMHWLSVCLTGWLARNERVAPLVAALMASSSFIIFGPFEIHSRRAHIVWLYWCYWILLARQQKHWLASPI